VVSRACAYSWRQRDHLFAKQWDDALAEAADRLDHIAWQRAVMSTIKEKLDHMPLKTGLQTELSQACSQLPSKEDIWRIAFSIFFGSVSIFCGSVIALTALYSAFS